MRDDTRRGVARGSLRDVPPAQSGGGLPMRIALIVSATVGMAALILALGRAQDASASRQPASPLAETAEEVAEPTYVAAEAEVFRTRIEDLAAGAGAERRASAHPRSLATYRALRAYPGAPPRIPHGLTIEELRGTKCLNCHERGGYAPRFSAYAPVTPHPEWEACLQCHAPDDALAGTSLPGSAPDARCRQCHVPSRLLTSAGTSNWRPSGWPMLASTPSFVPQDIPHDLQLRGNCVACHAGPGAVAEIRTGHPERANCLQCHVRPESDSSPMDPRSNVRAVSQSRSTP